MNHALSFFFRLHRRWLRLRRALTLGVRLIILRNETEVLLVRHTYLRGWYLPGGGVNHGETFEGAARRELLEECGLRAESLQLHGVFINPKGRHVDHIATFIARDCEGSPAARDSREIAEVRFFSLSELPNDLVAGQRRRLEEFMGQRPLSDRW
jgi:ADP-ribose pyrophosphatase YjhB (NUDIX family)